MLTSEQLSVNEEGHLTIGGVDTVWLAENYQTPLYVMNEDTIRRHCKTFRQSVQQYYGGHGLVCYASKAFCCLASE